MGVDDVPVLDAQEPDVIAMLIEDEILEPVEILEEDEVDEPGPLTRALMQLLPMEESDIEHQMLHILQMLRLDISRVVDENSGDQIVGIPIETFMPLWNPGALGRANRNAGDGSGDPQDNNGGNNGNNGGGNSNNGGGNSNNGGNNDNNGGTNDNNGGNNANNGGGNGNNGGNNANNSGNGNNGGNNANNGGNGNNGGNNANNGGNGNNGGNNDNNGGKNDKNGGNNDNNGGNTDNNGNSGGAAGVDNDKETFTLAEAAAGLGMGGNGSEDSDSSDEDNTDSDVKSFESYVLACTDDDDYIFLNIFDAHKLYLFKTAMISYRKLGKWDPNVVVGLRRVFGPAIVAALEYLEEGRVTVLVGQESRRTMVELDNDDGLTFYIYPGIAKCVCNSSDDGYETVLVDQSAGAVGGANVAVKKEFPLCEHVLAAHLAINLHSNEKYKYVYDGMIDTLMLMNAEKDLMEPIPKLPTPEIEPELSAVFSELLSEPFEPPTEEDNGAEAGN